MRKAASVSLAGYLFRAADPALDDKWWAPAIPGGGLSQAGVIVTPDTALQISTVYRCVSLIANGFASLPGGVFERVDPRTRREVEDHDAQRIFWVKPNPYQTPFAFKRMMMGHLALRGNCYARIYQGTEGPELWPLHPDRVLGPELLPSGRLRYIYTRPDTGQKEKYLGGIDIMALTGLSQDGLRGLAVSSLARDSIGLSMATEQHGARLFSMGVRLAGALKLPAGMEMGEETKRYLSKAFREEHRDYGLPVLEDGMEFTQMGMSSEDAQFLETRKFEVADIARWFGVPPHMIGDVERSTSWGTGIENQTIQFVTDGLLPWVVLWEQTIKQTLIPEPGFYAKFNINARLRADSKTRFEIYQIGIQQGIYSPNDCRAFEDENPREGGDVYVVPRGNNEPAPPPGPPAPAPPNQTAEARAAAALELSKGLAIGRARDLLREEQLTLEGLAIEHSRKPEAWRASVAAFYGRFWSSVTAAMLCSKDTASSWCIARRDAALKAGIAAFVEDGTGERDLVQMALAGIIGGENAA